MSSHDHNRICKQLGFMYLVPTLFRQSFSVIVQLQKKREKKRNQNKTKLKAIAIKISNLFSTTQLIFYTHIHNLSTIYLFVQLNHMHSQVPIILCRPANIKFHIHCPVKFHSLFCFYDTSILIPVLSLFGISPPFTLLPTICACLK